MAIIRQFNSQNNNSEQQKYAENLLTVDRLTKSKNLTMPEIDKLNIGTNLKEDEEYSKIYATLKQKGQNKLTPLTYAIYNKRLKAQNKKFAINDGGVTNKTLTELLKAKAYAEYLIGLNSKEVFTKTRESDIISTKQATISRLMSTLNGKEIFVPTAKDYLLNRSTIKNYNTMYNGDSFFNKDFKNLNRYKRKANRMKKRSKYNNNDSTQMRDIKNNLAQKINSEYQEKVNAKLSAKYGLKNYNVKGEPTITKLQFTEPKNKYTRAA